MLTSTIYIHNNSKKYYDLSHSFLTISFTRISLMLQNERRNYLKFSFVYFACVCFKKDVEEIRAKNQLEIEKIKFLDKNFES